MEEIPSNQRTGKVGQKAKTQTIDPVNKFRKAGWMTMGGRMQGRGNRSLSLCYVTNLPTARAMRDKEKRSQKLSAPTFEIYIHLKSKAPGSKKNKGIMGESVPHTPRGPTRLKRNCSWPGRTKGKRGGGEKGGGGAGGGEHSLIRLAETNQGRGAEK